MTEKSNQELQEDIELLQGQVEYLTGMIALQSSYYFNLLKKAANGKLSSSQIDATFPQNMIENSSNISFERNFKGKSQHFLDGFTEAKNHCLELYNHLSSSDL